MSFIGSKQTTLTTTEGKTLCFRTYSECSFPAPDEESELAE
jgi:hypothetical protein